MYLSLLSLSKSHSNAAVDERRADDEKLTTESRRSVGYDILRSRRLNVEPGSTLQETKKASRNNSNWYCAKGSRSTGCLSSPWTSHMLSM